jgi:hypothetical protein
VFGANSDATALRIASASAVIGATRELIARKSSVALPRITEFADVDHDALERQRSQRADRWRVGGRHAHVGNGRAPSI